MGRATSRKYRRRGKKNFKKAPPTKPTKGGGQLQLPEKPQRRKTCNLNNFLRGKKLSVERGMAS